MCGIYIYILNKTKKVELITNGIVVIEMKILYTFVWMRVFFIIWLHFSWINPGTTYQVYKVYYIACLYLYTCVWVSTIFILFFHLKRINVFRLHSISASILRPYYYKLYRKMCFNYVLYYVILMHCTIVVRN